MNKTESETKMGFFRKRSGAVLVFFVVVILASLFAANRSLSGRVREVTDLFSDGVYDSNVGYRLPSIKRQLEVRKDASQNLISAGAPYSEAAQETNALRSARNVLVNGLSNSVGAEKLHDANKELVTAFDALYGKLKTLSLKDSERSLADESQGRMENTAAIIQKSGYNEAVRQFSRDILSVFPTNYVMKFAFVNPPELFE